MTDRDAALLRCRIQNQRRELRKLNRHIAALNVTLQLSTERAARMYELYAAMVNRRYRSRAYRLWVWWRNRIVWRAGQWLPGQREQWNARTWYNKGVYDGAHHFRALKYTFPDEPRVK